MEPLETTGQSSDHGDSSELGQPVGPLEAPQIPSDHTDATPSDSILFGDMPLRQELIDSLYKHGFRKPTPIQRGVIPPALEGRDVLGKAQTGTGKTGAFLIPFFQLFSEFPVTSEPLGIVLAPTRELVVQVQEQAEKLAPVGGFKSVVIYGGVGFGAQLQGLERGCHLIVGTPGRVIDHLQRGTLKLGGIKYVVLDEADRMLDIGFRRDIEKILSHCPNPHQTLLLSATLPETVLRLVNRYQNNPVQVSIEAESPTVDKIRQYFVSVEEHQKPSLLLKVIEEEKPRQSIIFMERKRWAEDLYLFLKGKVSGLSMIHGDLPQGIRNQIMAAFRAGKVKHLVATDVVGRGIDVVGISHVFNYDIPEDPEAYVHRIGRTGRIGADGVAIALVAPEQGKRLTNIESFIDRLLEHRPVEGFDIQREIRVEAEPKPLPPMTHRKRYSNRL